MLRICHLKVLVIGMVLAALPGVCFAQLEPASPPVADPSDRRFVGVREDWNTPSLATSSLRPVRAMIGSVDEESNYTVELLQLQWRWGDPLDVYVIKPKGVKNPPVVLYLYGYPTDTDIFRDDKYQGIVTKGGFAAVGFVSALTGHRYHDRPMKEWFVSELQESLSTSAHDVQEVLDYLAGRGDLDMARVGIFANGSGASIAILASAVDPRIKVVDALDPWGDWPVWLEKSPFVPEEERPSYLKPEFLQKAGALDAVDWLPKMQAKKVRFQQSLFENVTPPDAKTKLRAAVPAGAIVNVFKSSEEYVAAMVGSKQLDWIKGELAALPGEPSPGTAASARGNSTTP